MKAGAKSDRSPLPRVPRLLVLGLVTALALSCSSERMTEPDPPDVVVSGSPTSATVPVWGLDTPDRCRAERHDVVGRLAIRGSDRRPRRSRWHGDRCSYRVHRGQRDLAFGRSICTGLDRVTAAQSSTIEIVITNSLYNAANITVNGAVVGSVPARSTRQTQVLRTGSASVSWSLVRTTTTSGVPVGDDISGHFDPVVNPGDRINYAIDAVVGQTFIFRPIIVNQTGLAPLMGVNEGLQSQNPCNCTVPAGSTGTAIGYHFLFQLERSRIPGRLGLHRQLHLLEQFRQRGGSLELRDPLCREHRAGAGHCDRASGIRPHRCTIRRDVSSRPPTCRLEGRTREESHSRGGDLHAHFQRRAESSDSRSSVRGVASMFPQQVRSTLKGPVTMPAIEPTVITRPFPSIRRSANGAVTRHGSGRLTSSWDFTSCSETSISGPTVDTPALLAGPAPR